MMLFYNPNTEVISQQPVAGALPLETLPFPVVGRLQQVELLPPSENESGGFTRQWQVTDLPLDEAKNRLVAGVNSVRDRLEESGFSYLGKWVDSDPRSCQRISLAANAAMLAMTTSTAIELNWKCADDSVLTLDAPGICAMAVALAQHAASLHYHARELKAQIAAAGTLADLQALSIDMGWPL